MKILNKKEIAQLERVLFKLFTFHQKLRNKTKIAEKIRLPSVPSVLSESMVILSVHKLFNLNSSWEAFRGGRDCDVLIKCAEDKIRVEVKATGKQETLEIKDRDINCDRLVWINFGFRFQNGEGPITIYVLYNPPKHLKLEDSTNRITNLAAFLGKVGDTADLLKFEFEDLKEFLKICKDIPLTGKKKEKRKL